MTVPARSPSDRPSAAHGGPNGYLLDVVRKELEAKLSVDDADVDHGGLRIVTTFDKTDQAAAVAGDQGRAADHRRPGRARRPRLDRPGQRCGRGDVRRRRTRSPSRSTPRRSHHAGRLDVQAVRADRGAAAGHQPEVAVQRRQPDEGRGLRRSRCATSATSSSARSTWCRPPSTRSTPSSPSSTRRSARTRPGTPRSAAGLPETTAGLSDNPANVLGTASPHVDRHGRRLRNHCGARHPRRPVHRGPGDQHRRQVNYKATQEA